jgi:hypothetical protein
MVARPVQWDGATARGGDEVGEAGIAGALRRPVCRSPVRAWPLDSGWAVVSSTGGVCGGIPLAFTIAQCQSWSGNKAKFKAVRNSAVAEGAADPLAFSMSVISGCLGCDSG